MGMESKSGLTEQSMKVIGSTTRRMDEGSFGMQMATCTKASGLMTRRMAMEFTCM